MTALEHSEKCIQLIEEKTSLEKVKDNKEKEVFSVKELNIQKNVNF